jgi:hypothetical protein
MIAGRKAKKNIKSAIKLKELKVSDFESLNSFSFTLNQQTPPLMQVAFY